MKDLLSSGHKVTGLTTTPDGARKLQAAGAKARVGKLDDRASAARGRGRLWTGRSTSPSSTGLSNMSLPTRLRLFAGVLNRWDRPELSEHPCGNGVRRHRGFGRRSRKLQRALWSWRREFLACRRARFRPNATTMCRWSKQVFSERAALDLIARGVRSSIVKLPPTVHGAGEHGFMSRIIEVVRKKGVSPYIGDGANRWPAAHVSDVARLFRLALEKGEAGAKFHGADDVGVPFREIASLISTKTATSRLARHSGGEGRQAFRHHRQFRRSRYIRRPANGPGMRWVGDPSSPACSPTLTPTILRPSVWPPRRDRRFPHHSTNIEACSCAYLSQARPERLYWSSRS